jgi:hypothetical protein
MMIGFGIPISFVTLAFGIVFLFSLIFYTDMNTISTTDIKSENPALVQKKFIRFCFPSLLLIC